MPLQVSALQYPVINMLYHVANMLYLVTDMLCHVADMLGFQIIFSPSLA